MAAIIPAAALSGVSRQLRRPGVAAPATPAAMATSTATSPSTSPATPAPEAAAAIAVTAANALGASGAMAMSAVSADPVAPVQMVTPAAVFAPPPQQTSAPPAEPSPIVLREERLALQMRALEAETRSLRQQQEAVEAAKTALALQQAALADQAAQLAAARRQLADEADEVKAQATLRGHAAGLEQGERAAEDAVAAQVARVSALAQALAQAKRALLEENQDMLVEIAFTATCRMLGRHAATRAGIESMVLTLIENERDLETLSVRLHPRDAGLLGAVGARLDPRIRIEADAGVELGGCLVDSARGTLDARLERQLQYLRAALTAVRERQGDTEVPV